MPRCPPWGRQHRGPGCSGDGAAAAPVLTFRVAVATVSTSGLAPELTPIPAALGDGAAPTPTFALLIPAAAASAGALTPELEPEVVPNQGSVTGAAPAPTLALPIPVAQVTGAGAIPAFGAAMVITPPLALGQLQAVALGLRAQLRSPPVARRHLPWRQRCASRVRSRRQRVRPRRCPAPAPCLFLGSSTSLPATWSSVVAWPRCRKQSWPRPWPTAWSWGPQLPPSASGTRCIPARARSSSGGTDPDERRRG